MPLGSISNNFDFRFFIWDLHLIDLDLSHELGWCTSIDANNFVLAFHNSKAKSRLRGLGFNRFLHSILKMGACSSQPISYQQGNCAPCAPCVPCVPCSSIPPCAAIVPCAATVPCAASVPCVPCLPLAGAQGSAGPLCAPTGPCYPAGQVDHCPCVPMQQPTATAPCVPCVPCVAGGAPLGCMPGQVTT